MPQQLPITVVVYNGEFLETPTLMYFDCDLVQYVNTYNARTYDINDCIVVKRVFGFLYGNDLWGTFDFKTIEEFIAFRDSYCLEDTECGVQINGCFFFINNNCRTTINGY